MASRLTALAREDVPNETTTPSMAAKRSDRSDATIFAVSAAAGQLALIGAAALLIDGDESSRGAGLLCALVGLVVLMVGHRGLSPRPDQDAHS